MINPKEIDLQHHLLQGRLKNIFLQTKSFNALQACSIIRIETS
jgi:hypothetical protein